MASYSMALTMSTMFDIVNLPRAQFTHLEFLPIDLFSPEEVSW